MEETIVHVRFNVSFKIGKYLCVLVAHITVNGQTWKPFWIVSYGTEMKESRPVAFSCVLASYTVIYQKGDN